MKIDISRMFSTKKIRAVATTAALAVLFIMAFATVFTVRVRAEENVYHVRLITSYTTTVNEEPVTYNPTLLNVGTGTDADISPLEFDVRGGEKFILPIPVAAASGSTNYVFCGWYADEARTVPMAINQTAPTTTSQGDFPFYAKWSVATEVSGGYFTDSNGTMGFKYTTNDFYWRTNPVPSIDIVGKKDGMLNGEVFPGRYNQVTYSKDGFVTRIKIKKSDSSFLDLPEDGLIRFDGGTWTRVWTDPENEEEHIDVSLIPAIEDNGKTVSLNYYVRNTDNEEYKISIGSGADVMIGGDDSAGIYPEEQFDDSGNTTCVGFRMVSKNSNDYIVSDEGSENLQFIFFGRMGDGVTPTDTIWYSGYTNYHTYIFTDQCTGNLENRDSGAAWSWTDRAISNGQTLAFCVKVAIGGEEALGAATVIGYYDTENPTQSPAIIIKSGKNFNAPKFVPNGPMLVKRHAVAHGWYYDADHTTPCAIEGNEHPDMSEHVQHTSDGTRYVNLYHKWEPEEGYYTIHYYIDNEPYTSKTGATYVMYDNVLEEEDLNIYVPNKETSNPNTSRKFSGWYLDRGCTRRVNAGDNYTFDRDINLYGFYYPANGPESCPYSHHTIFMYIAGEDTPRMTMANQFEIPELPSVDPVPEGKRFDGWYTDEECTTRVRIGQSIFQDKNVYGKFVDSGTEPQTTGHKLTLNVDGEIKAVLEEITVIPELFDIEVASGSAFDGWYSDPNCTIRVDAGTVLDRDRTIFGRTVPAGDGDSGDPQGTPVSGTTITMKVRYTDSEDFVVYQTINNATVMPALPNLDSELGEDKYCDGWYSEEACQHRVSAGLPVTGGAVTIYAVVRERTGYEPEPTDYPMPDPPTGDPISEITALHSIQLKVVSNGAAEVKYKYNYLLQVPELPALEATGDAIGLFFDGWYSNVECTIAAPVQGTILTADIDVYARFVETNPHDGPGGPGTGDPDDPHNPGGSGEDDEDRYTLTFVFDGTEIATMQTSVIPALPVPQVGSDAEAVVWYMEPDCINRVNIGAVLTSDLSLYGYSRDTRTHEPIVPDSVDSAVEIYRLELYFNGVLYSRINNVISIPALPQIGVYEEGMVFDGWYYDEAYTDRVQTGVSITAEMDEQYATPDNVIKLYARKKSGDQPGPEAGAEKYAVTMFLEGTVNGRTYNKELWNHLDNLSVIETLPEPAPASGYRFDGWYTDSQYQHLLSYGLTLTESMAVYGRIVTDGPDYDPTRLPRCPGPGGHPWADLYPFDRSGTAFTLPTITLVVDGEDYSVLYNQTSIPQNLPVLLDRNGNVFDGWYTSDTYSEHVVPGTAVTNNIRIYGRYVEQGTGTPVIPPAQTFKITTVVDGIPTGYVYATEVPDLQCPVTEDGKVFGGWFSDPEYKYILHTGTILSYDVIAYGYTADSTTGIPTTPENNPPYGPVSGPAVGTGAYTITLKVDGNPYGTINNVTTISGLPSTIDGLAAYKRFSGWYTDEGCTTAAVLGAILNSNITLYGQTHDVQQPVVPTPTPTPGPATESGFTLILLVDNSEWQRITGVTVMPVLPTKSVPAGTRFDGWYTDSACTHRVNYGVSLTGDESQEICLYAVTVEDGTQPTPPVIPDWPEPTGDPSDPSDPYWPEDPNPERYPAGNVPTDYSGTGTDGLYTVTMYVNGLEYGVIECVTAMPYIPAPSKVRFGSLEGATEALTVSGTAMSLDMASFYGWYSDEEYTSPVATGASLTTGAAVYGCFVGSEYNPDDEPGSGSDPHYPTGETPGTPGTYDNASVSGDRKITLIVDGVEFGTIYTDADGVVPQLPSPIANLAASGSGLTFVGWFTDANYTYLLNVGSIIDHDIPAYGYTFDMDNRQPTEPQGPGTPNPGARRYKITQKVFVGDELTEYGTVENLLTKPVLTKPVVDEGKEFIGWYTDETLTTPYAAGEALTEDIAVYGKIQDEQGSDPGTDPGTDPSGGDPDDDPDNPENNPNYDPSAVYTITMLVDGTPWNFINGVRAIPVLGTPAADAGKVFDGWYTDSSYTYNVSYGVRLTSSIVVYGRFVDDSGSGSGSDPVTPADTYTVSLYVDGSLHSTIPGLTNMPALPTIASGAGVRFDAWYYDEEYTLPVTTVGEQLTADKSVYGRFVSLSDDTPNPGTPGTGNEPGDGDNPGGDTHRASFRLTTVVDDTITGTYFYDVVPELPIPQVDAGKVFDGWYTDETYTYRIVPGTLLTRNTTVYGRTATEETIPSATEYTITFVVSGTAVSSITCRGTVPTLGTIAVSVNERFDGWYYNSDYTNEVHVGDTVSENISIYGRIVSRSENNGSDPGAGTTGYTITYYLNGSVMNTIHNVTTIEVLPVYNPEDADEVFDGWYDSNMYRHKVNVGTTVTSDINLYARTVPNDTYLPVPDDDCPQPDYPRGYVPEIPTYRITLMVEGTVRGRIEGVSAIPVLPVIQPESGYVFSGWYTTVDCASGSAVSVGDILYSNITVYGKFLEEGADNPDDGSTTSSAHKITFFVNNLETGYVYATEIPPLSRPSVETGKEFVGWYTDSAFTYMVNIGSILEGDISLYGYTRNAETHVPDYVPGGDDDGPGGDGGDDGGDGSQPAAIEYFDVRLHVKDRTITLSHLRFMPSPLPVPTIGIGADEVFRDWYYDVAFQYKVTEGAALLGNTDIYARIVTASAIVAPPRTINCYVDDHSGTGMQLYSTITVEGDRMPNIAMLSFPDLSRTFDGWYYWYYERVLSDRVAEGDEIVVDGIARTEIFGQILGVGYDIKLFIRDMHTGNYSEYGDIERTPVIPALPMPQLTEGEYFSGWCYDTDLTEEANRNDTVTGQTNLYGAIWYKVKVYDENGWYLTDELYTTSLDSRITVPTRQGYTFNGWLVFETANASVVSVGAILHQGDDVLASISIKPTWTSIPDDDGPGGGDDGPGGGGHIIPEELIIIQPDKGTDDPEGEKDKKPGNTTTYKIPVSSDDTLEVTTQIDDDGIGVLDDVPKEDLEKIVDKHEEIIIDLSESPVPVKGVDLPKDLLRAIADLLNDESNNAKRLIVKFGDYTVAIDAQALMSILEQAGDTTLIRLVVDDKDEQQLNDNQQDRLKEYTVERLFEAYFESNGMRIKSFDGGSVEVSVKFDMPKDRTIDNYHIFYLPEEGAFEQYITNYADGQISFVTGHFSDYAIVSEENVKPAITTLNLTKVVKVGKHFDLGISSIPEGAKVTWKSSDKKIASVSKDGCIYGKKEGEATVTCKVVNGETTYRIKIRVLVKPLDGNNLSLKEEAYKSSEDAPVFNFYKRIAKGSSYKLRFTDVADDAKITYRSLDTSVATVSKKGRITGVGAGTTTIMVRIETQDSAFEYAVTVRLVDHDLEEQPEVPAILYNYDLAVK